VGRGGELPAGLAGSELAARVLFVALIAALALLCYRWVRLAPVYRSIYERRRAEATQFTDLFRLFEKLVVRAYGQADWLPRPRLLIIENAPCPAFAMGMRLPVVVLSANLARQLGTRELTGILAHELAHVRRLDYVGRWVATVLRDIMLWNPFVVLWYSQLADEQEKACDEYGAELLDDPVAVASGLVEVGAYVHRPPKVAVGPLAAWHMGRHPGRLRERVDHLERQVRRPNGLPKLPTSVLYPILVAFVLAQPHVAVSLPDLYALVTRCF
jgi:Zn-dependent protease with chaperone function